MIIAIDYDGTIADTNRQKVRWIAEKLGLSIPPWACNRTDCVPLVGLEAYEKMGAYVYEREGTLTAAEVPGALEALVTLSTRAVLHLVTARPAKRLDHARRWLQKQGVLACFENLHTSAESTKAGVCTAIGANVLIDDDIRHLENIRSDGLKRIWLQHGRRDRPALGAGILFCNSWQEVVDGCEY